MSENRNSASTNSDAVPCPRHGYAAMDSTGKCMPSCGFGWDRDPLSMVRDEYRAEGASR